MGAPRLLCTRARIANLAAIPHIPYDMCETDSPCASRDHERLRTARRLASRAATAAPFGVGRPQDTKAAFAAHEFSRMDDKLEQNVEEVYGISLRLSFRKTLRLNERAPPKKRASETVSESP